MLKLGGLKAALEKQAAHIPLSTTQRIRAALSTIPKPRLAGLEGIDDVLRQHKRGDISGLKLNILRRERREPLQAPRRALQGFLNRTQQAAAIKQRARFL